MIYILICAKNFLVFYLCNLYYIIIFASLKPNFTIMINPCKHLVFENGQFHCDLDDCPFFTFTTKCVELYPHEVLRKS